MIKINLKQIIYLVRKYCSNGARITLTSLIAALACTGIIYAATTVGTNISTTGTLSVTASTTFNGIEYGWPSSDGSANQVLTTNSSGVLSWAAASGGSGSGTLNYGAAGAISFYSSAGTTATGTASSLLYWDDTNARLGIGTTSPYAKLSVVGEIVGSYFTVTSTTATSTIIAPLVVNNTIRSRQLRDSGNIIPNYAYMDIGFDSIYLRPHPGAVNPVLHPSDITISGETVGGVADPFLFYEDGVWYMLFEIIVSSSGKNRIGYATSDDGLSWTYQGVVLNDDPNYHLSYSYIFKYDGEYYMVPSSGIYNFGIYKATTFPTNWAIEDDITLPGAPSSADLVVFQFKGLWWAIFGSAGDCSVSPDLTNCDTYAYWSTDLIGGTWTAHSANSGKIVSERQRASRPGGRPIVRDDYIIFFYQDASSDPRALTGNIHDGGDNASTLSDASGDFVNDGVTADNSAPYNNGDHLNNITDGSSCIITAVNATTVTCTLQNGAENDWDNGDIAEIDPAVGQYGHRVRAFKIDTLTTSAFNDVELSNSPVLVENSNETWRNFAHHHVDIWPTSFGNGIAAVDAEQDSSGYSIGIFEVGSEKYANNFDIWANELTLGGDEGLTGVRTDATNKRAYLATPHRINSEEKVLMTSISQTGGGSIINFGGGFSPYNAATGIRFYTAETNTEVTGTNSLFHDGFLTNATADESALELTYEVNKLTSGDAYGLKIVPTDTALPASSSHFGISIGDITGNGVAKAIYIGTGWDDAIIIKDGSRGIRFGGAGIQDISFDLDPLDGSQPANNCNNDGDVGSIYVDMDTGENASALCVCLKTGASSWAWTEAAVGNSGTCD